MTEHEEADAVTAGRNRRSGRRAKPASASSGPTSPGPTSAGPTSPGSRSATRDRRAGAPTGPRFAKPLNAGSILGWTLLSAILPGAAHLRAGQRRIGFAMLGAFAALLLTVLAIFLINRDQLGMFSREAGSPR